MNNINGYNKAYERSVRILTDLYNNNQHLDDSSLRDLLYKEYRSKKLDPDGKAVRIVLDVKCTADALLSMNRICNMEENVAEIMPVFIEYRRTPIFFFPCERGGINTSRATILGDKIDHTLYDLKLYYEGNKDECRLINSYTREITKRWLEEIGSFEALIDWFGIKGIFTNDKYDVYDLEHDDNRIIGAYKSAEEYQQPWSEQYYNNIKKRTEMYLARRL